MKKKNRFGRWGPFLGLGLAMAIAYYFDLQTYLSLDYLIGKRVFLQSYVAEHLALSIFIYALVYVAVVALSLPGASILSIAGGFIFGWMLSAPITIVAATIGATAVFQIVKSSLGESVAKRATSYVNRLSDGFAQDAFNYLLFLRLVPVFPFFAVNAVAGLCRVSLRSFTLGTFIGIIPGAYIFAWVGSGLGNVISTQMAQHEICVAKDGLNNCPYEISISSLITPQLFIALTALGLLALVPVVFKKFKAQQ
jgi:uncharacterized membrane protein YdjX (TVP38/TMEM64 family)